MLPVIGWLVTVLILASAAHNVKAQIPAPKPPAASPPAPSPFTTGPRVPIGLADAVFIGLRDNRTVKSEYITRVADKFQLFVAKTRFWPTALLGASDLATATGQQLNGSNLTVDPTVSWLAPTGAQFQFSWNYLAQRSPGSSAASNTLNLSITQPLLNGGGLAVNEAPIRVAELQEKIGHLTLKSTVITTVSSIITAYRALLEAQDQVVIAQQALDRSNDQLATNQAMIDAGRMAASEIVQTRAEIANQQVSLIQAEQQRNSAQLALLALLAMDLHTNIVAADPIKAEPVNIDVDQAIALALDNRPDYLSERMTLEQSKQNLIVAKNERLWTLSVVADLQHQASSGASSTLVNPTTGAPLVVAGAPAFSGSIGLQLSIPIGNFSLQEGEVLAATTVRTNEIGLDDLREQIEAQVRDAVQGVELSWRQVEAARLARDLAAQTLALEQEKLKAGRTSNFEVLTFETNLNAAASQELTASITYLNALTSLDQQLGSTLDTWKIQLDD